MPPLPSRLRYLQPVFDQFADLPPVEHYEDVDTSVLEKVLGQRVEGRSDAEANDILRADRKALGDWLAKSGEPALLAHFVHGWMMMQRVSLIGVDDAVETISDLLSETGTAPLGRVFGPLPLIEPAISALVQNDGNLFLYVSNSSFEPQVVDVCIEIDGQIVIHDVFEHQLMHDFTRYRIRLAHGEHHLLATSQCAVTRLEQRFVIGDVLHASVAFWYSRPSAFGAERPPSFTFHADTSAWIPEHGWKQAK